nr:putative ribonuclease H-like domain-containing protein [Tanacetum cinerariifolium]
MYSFNLKNSVPSGGLACLIVKAIVDESTKWHMRFSWVFFLTTKDETSGILKDFIRQIRNQLNQKVKTIRCDNGTEFKNRDTIEFCGSKGIKREYSNARTPQQNRVAERKSRTAAKTMLVDLVLPNTFRAEAVSIACYVLNRVLVTKPYNKTPYELITGTSEIEADHAQEYYVLPLWSSYTSTVKSTKAKNGDEKLNEDTDSKTNERSVDQEDQAFLEELKRLKRQEKEANDAAKTLRKTFA